MKKNLSLLLIGLTLALGVFGFFYFYSYIFVRHISGEIVHIEAIGQLNAPGAVLPPAPIPAPSSSTALFAIAIQEKNGDILTAMSASKEWVVAEKGQCVEAKLFPYPPWKLGKAGSYFEVQLLKLKACEHEK